MPAAPDIRRAQLAKIHMRKDELRLSDDLYRSIIARVSGGKTSSADLDAGQRTRLLDEMERLGASNTRPPAPVPKSPGELQIAKIKRLWLELDRIGALDKIDQAGGAEQGAAESATRGQNKDQALRKFVKRVTHRDALEWLSVDDSNKVIEGLKAWLDRVTNRR